MLMLVSIKLFVCNMNLIMDTRSLVSKNIAYLRSDTLEDRVACAEVIARHGGHAASLYASQAFVEIALTAIDVNEKTRLSHLGKAESLASKVQEAAAYTGTQVEESMRVAMLQADLPTLRAVYLYGKWPKASHIKTQYKMHRDAAVVPQGDWSTIDDSGSRFLGAQTELAAKLLLGRHLTRGESVGRACVYSSLFSEDNSAYTIQRKSRWDITLLTNGKGLFNKEANKLQVKLTRSVDRPEGDVTGICFRDVLQTVGTHYRLQHLLYDVELEAVDEQQDASKRLDQCTNTLVDMINA